MSPDTGCALRSAPVSPQAKVERKIGQLGDEYGFLWLALDDVEWALARPLCPSLANYLASGIFDYPSIGQSRLDPLAEVIDPPDERCRTAGPVLGREDWCLWRPPLGVDEMASIERTAAGFLVPYLADLSGGGDDAGALVVRFALSGLEIHLPESS